MGRPARALVSILEGCLLSGASAAGANADAGSWSAAAPMLQARTEAAAATLGDGRVLVAGGQDADARLLDTAELYDPATGHWSEAAPMPFAGGVFAAAAALPGVRIIVAGGNVHHGNFAPRPRSTTARRTPGRSRHPLRSRWILLPPPRSRGAGRSS